MGRKRCRSEASVSLQAPSSPRKKYQEVDTPRRVRIIHAVNQFEGQVPQRDIFSHHGVSVRTGQRIIASGQPRRTRRGGRGRGRGRGHNPNAQAEAQAEDQDQAQAEDQAQPQAEDQDQAQIYQLVFYVPQTHTQQCLDALFAVGAGIWPNPPKPTSTETSSTTNPTSSTPTPTPAPAAEPEAEVEVKVSNQNQTQIQDQNDVGDEDEPKYTDSCFISSGTGQFRPSASADPHIGTAGGQVEHVLEDRVEMVVAGGPDAVRSAVAALRRAHPYEVAAFFVFKSEFF
ncbi:hypothetical protein A1O3_01511 [Capronia epimyces CBS 606.96]|uniref:ATP phosphoribosyltransferase n=1 Tax=Capronia epimyces CBS 606.96 TaxID=1182542 RepID=W9YTH3_9EURO|nr:uncharacterized protein A1O3_01511 [Capronia epimyces CBS 606.96]EXJ92955.1 hypothetical protein A1O3_01511 [Capronia epimyces CBS 606.96]